MQFVNAIPPSNLHSFQVLAYQLHLIVYKVRCVWFDVMGCP